MPKSAPKDRHDGSNLYQNVEDLRKELENLQNGLDTWRGWQVGPIADGVHKLSAKIYDLMQVVQTYREENAGTRSNVLY